MKKWMKDLWKWLRSYPRPWRVVRITGDVVGEGGSITVGPGVTLEITGNIVQRGPGYAIKASDDVTITGSMRAERNDGVLQSGHCAAMTFGVGSRT